ncbi:hypothetical protein EJ05DRAFT_498068 [Pseudovirgaria hyperparasitica]|uniref:Uncharacterized protein n=1 Tax=Pseudovirgaria hyperparasitica TaxID=470096 RepID=A0A6A6WET8_9PEZI|nr:uncharacterized protein EJ05DRAFT_498068 [Pseudovirgaria hyperparasitica]KAF2760097.1 hypothetical protein EJ05DRAFT_498068 [Pseudovirgaria hyperparasitica]
MSDLQFINYENPAEAKKRSNKRAVKSQAARHHWARDVALRTNRSKQFRRTQNSNLVVRQGTYTQDESGYHHQTEPYSTHPSIYQTGPTESVPALQTLQNPSHDTIRGDQVQLVGLLGAGRVDPFHTYPVTWQEYFPELVDHYIMNIAVRVPTVDGPRGEGQLRTRWFPLAMTDPATFSGVLLLSASHLHSVRVKCSIQEKPEDAIRLLTLKEQAIRVVNEALGDPLRSCSDAIIGAVVKLCCYEAIYDNVDAYMIHMKGLQSMVAARGGLSELGVNGLLRRICIWIDLKSAALNRTPLFFEDSIMISQGGASTTAEQRPRIIGE